MNKLNDIDIDQLKSHGYYEEYTKAVNPLYSGKIKKVPFKYFSSLIHETGPSKIHPLDISQELECDGPATSPGLCANFVRILKNENVTANFNATSQLIYIIKGSGWSQHDDLTIPWYQGDFVVLPIGKNITHHAHEETAMYLIHDEPLLSYLGAKANYAKFKPTLYTSENSLLELSRVQKEAEAKNRSRISVILINEASDQTQTVTHTLWAMLGILPKGSSQLPHRHQSVALDLILDCNKGCYTLVGDTIDIEGKIVNPTRIDWQANSAFITPPGLWHAHFNESSEDVNFIPIQDAGLHIFLRSLDIKFVLPNQAIPSP